MLEEWEIEGLADGAIRAAGLDPDERQDAIRLARKLVGPVKRLHAAGLPGDAVLCRVNGERRIYVRGRLTPAALRWATLHETAEAVLDDEGYRESDLERVADRLAASLGAPLRAALRACRAVGDDWSELAGILVSTESSAALRFGEVTHEPLALVAPALIRYRGDAFAWPEEMTMRAKRTPGLVKTRLRDDMTRRVVRAL